MRNRVADRGVRKLIARAVVIMVLVPATLAVVTGQAGAVRPGNLAAGHFSLGVAGPVGIVAVLLGACGLLAGLLRRRIGAGRADASRVLLDQPSPASSAVPVKAGQVDRVS
jgi:hypothetical protein